MKVQVTMTETITQSYTKDVEMTQSEYNRYIKGEASQEESWILVQEVEAGEEAVHEETKQWISNVEKSKSVTPLN
tara:strand:- start:4667 stop:4891 length:225 start_codon:yes stop_codon:yes gene_type:complete